MATSIRTWIASAQRLAHTRTLLFVLGAYKQLRPPTRDIGTRHRTGIYPPSGGGHPRRMAVQPALACSQPSTTDLALRTEPICLSLRSRRAARHLLRAPSIWHMPLGNRGDGHTRHCAIRATWASSRRSEGCRRCGGCVQGMPPPWPCDTAAAEWGALQTEPVGGTGCQFVVTCRSSRAHCQQASRRQRRASLRSRVCTASRSRSICN